jgi:outer membrane protein TolC
MNMEQNDDIGDHVELAQLWALQARIEQLQKQLEMMNKLCEVQSAGVLSLARQQAGIHEELEQMVRFLHVLHLRVGNGRY